MRDHPKQQAVEIEEQELDDVVGGLLLPAVQKVRDAAARASSSSAATPEMGERS